MIFWCFILYFSGDLIYDFPNLQGKLHA